MSTAAAGKVLTKFINRLEALREDVPIALEEDYEELVGQAELLKTCFVAFVDSLEAEEETDDFDDYEDDDEDEEEDDEEEDDEYDHIT